MQRRGRAGQARGHQRARTIGQVYSLRLVYVVMTTVASKQYDVLVSMSYELKKRKKNNKPLWPPWAVGDAKQT
jgi:hypothetical protein